MTDRLENLRNRFLIVQNLEEAQQRLVEAQVLMQDAPGISTMTRTLRTDLSRVLTRVRSYGSK
jgi:hypothetical protein